eukprot:7902825-Lingulodinium_polyedra.AAC.1
MAAASSGGLHAGGGEGDKGPLLVTLAVVIAHLHLLLLLLSLNTLAGHEVAHKDYLELLEGKTLIHTAFNE